jgi:hypothetical protein
MRARAYAQAPSSPPSRRLTASSHAERKVRQVRRRQAVCEDDDWPWCGRSRGLPDKIELGLAQAVRLVDYVRWGPGRSMACVSGSGSAR